MVDRVIGFEIEADAKPAIDALRSVDKQTSETVRNLRKIAVATGSLAVNQGLRLIKSQVEDVVEAFQEMYDWLTRLIRHYATLAAAGLGIFGAIANEARKAADEIAKQSRNIGFAAESYQTLSYAFRIGGQGADGLFKAVGRLQYATVQASYGLATYTRIFDELGIEIDEFLKLQPERQMRVVLSALQGLDSQTLKSGLAIQLFGRAGRRLIATLGDSSDSIRELEADLRSVGGVATNEALGAMEQLNDTILTFKTVAVAQISEGLSSFIEEFGDLRNVAYGFGQVIRQLTDALVWLGRVVVENLDLIRGVTYYLIFRPLAGSVVKLVLNIGVLAVGFKLLRAAVIGLGLATTALPKQFQGIIGVVSQLTLGFNATSVGANAANASMVGSAVAAVKMRIAMTALLATLGPIVLALIAASSAFALSSTIASSTLSVDELNDSLSRSRDLTKEVYLQWGSFAEVAVDANDQVRETIKSMLESGIELTSFNREGQLAIEQTRGKLQSIAKERLRLSQLVADKEQEIVDLQTPGSGRYQISSNLRLQGIRAAELEINKAQNSLRLSALDVESANDTLNRQLNIYASTIADNSFGLGESLEEIPEAVGATIRALSLKTDEIARQPIDLGRNRIEFGEFGEAVTVFGSWGRTIETASAAAALGIQVSQADIALRTRLYDAVRQGNAVLADRATIEKEIIDLNRQLKNDDLSQEGRSQVLAHIASLEEKLLTLPETQLRAVEQWVNATSDVISAHERQILNQFDATLAQITSTPLDLSDLRIEYGEFGELVHVFGEFEGVAANVRIAMEKGIALQDVATETQIQLNQAIRTAQRIEEERAASIAEIARLQDQINQRGLTGAALQQVNDQIDLYEGYLDRLAQAMGSTVQQAQQASISIANTTLDTEVLIHPLQELAYDFIDGVSGSFERAIATGNFESLGDSLVAAIQASFARAITERLAGLLKDLLADTLFAGLSGGAGGGGGIFSTLLGFASGGIVPGTQGQAVPILAHAGEVVLNRQQQQALLNGGARGGGTVNVTMQVTGDVSVATRRAVLGMSRELTDIVQAGLTERRAFA